MSAEPEIVVVEFDPRYAADFAALNYEWIEAAYTVEEHDRELLDHPCEHIILTGGQIFFGLSDGQAVGTVAMVNIDPEEFELAKMAVAPQFQGRGISSKLMERCIAFAREKCRRRITLESNTRQVAAIELYRKFGFTETPLDPKSLFVRANIRMELAL